MNAGIRIGQGVDIHAFGEGDEVIIGGVRIPFEKSLIAHSDGDVLIHALMDALLGALALGDIGQHFPDTDNQYRGVDSRSLLRKVYELISQRGYCLANADMTLIAQAPKMAPHISAMKRNIASDLSATEEQVSIKATTSEKLGFTGRKEGITALATVLVSRCA